MNAKKLFLAAAVGAALLPASASAGTAAFSNGTFAFTAAPGEDNYLIADVSTTDCAALGITPCFTFFDSPVYPIVPPPGCVNHQFSESSLECAMPESLRIDAGDHRDTVMDWNGPSAIDAGDDDDSVFGHAGQDVISGGEGGDVLIGGVGDDSIDGGPGNDLMESPIAGYEIAERPGPSDSGGADTLVGGSGTDEVSYQLRIDALWITLDGLANDGAPGEHDRIAADVEGVIGGQGSDVMVGSARSEGLYGYGGNDNIHGGKGDDTLDGGPGNDLVDGGLGADTVSGGHDQDLVSGGPGRDNIYGEYALGCDLLERCVGGADILRANDGERDLISCGVGTDRADIDRIDIVRDIPGSTECEGVFAVRAKTGCAKARSKAARRKCLRGRRG